MINPLFLKPWKSKLPDTMAEVHQSAGGASKRKSRKVLPSFDAPGPAQEEAFVGNTILTSKYTLLSFLPQNLFEQFSRAANLYFLFIAILQLTPGLSPTHWITTVAPLVLVLCINMAKEIYDDYGRHKSDYNVNSAPTEVLAGDAARTVPWREVKVGDIVRVKRDEEIPADLVFLASSHAQHFAYVETANLDGETNLKDKTAYKRTAGVSPASAAALQKAPLFSTAYLECEQPNNDLYKFEANFVVGEEAREPLQPDQLLLRGSTLRNVEWVLGMVVFTGKDSKVMRNMVPAPRKVSQLERHMNKLVILVFLIMIIISLIMMILQTTTLDTSRWYLLSNGEWPELHEDTPLGMLVHFLRYIILLNQLIPISLYVTLEMVKVIQCVFLSYDKHMYSPENDVRFLVRTTTLNEELGQVEYVLSDKTGTLTQNLMAFVRCTVGKDSYGDSVKATAGAAEGSGAADNPHLICKDALLRARLKGGAQGDAAAARAHEFFQHILLSNTVLPTKVGSRMVYQSNSPEEEAMVTAAADFGYTLLFRDAAVAKARIRGAEATFQILTVLKFNSTRKRMSVIVRDAATGRIQLLCKGADSVIFDRLGKTEDPARMQTMVDAYSREGLRTLLLASRDLTEQQFEEWQAKHHQASTALEGRDEAEDKVAEEIEVNLHLVGAVAVDDKLQDGVAQAIADLITAGVKVWMLTGDKMETAISIGKSCHLLDDQTELKEFPAGTLDSEPDLLVSTLAEISRQDELSGQLKQKVGMVIESSALEVALKEANQEDFLKLCRRCQAVICCRVSPLQKAQVTNLLKLHAGAVTLGIGDGANDVGMIKAAHIGVGVSGREGRQAVLAADYAVGQFRFLTRLLLVHGRWSYLRNKEVVMYAFYKNFAYCLGNVWISFLSGFSSQPLYSAALIASFNVFWTSFPTIAYAAFEQDVKAPTVMANPQLYLGTSREKERHFIMSVLQWLAVAIWHSLIIFWGVTYATAGPAASISPVDGRIAGFWSTGLTVYTVMIVVANLKVAMRTRHWTWVNHFWVWAWSIGMWVPFVVFVSGVWTSMSEFPEMHEVDGMLFPDPTFWLTVLLFSVTAIIPDMAVEFGTRVFAPSDATVLQAMENAPEEKQRADQYLSRNIDV